MTRISGHGDSACVLGREKKKGGPRRIAKHTFLGDSTGSVFDRVAIACRKRFGLNMSTCSTHTAHVQRDGRPSLSGKQQGMEAEHVQVWMCIHLSGITISRIIVIT